MKLCGSLSWLLFALQEHCAHQKQAEWWSDAKQSVQQWLNKAWEQKEPNNETQSANPNELRVELWRGGRKSRGGNGEARGRKSYSFSEEQRELS